MPLLAQKDKDDKASAKSVKGGSTAQTKKYKTKPKDADDTGSDTDSNATAKTKAKKVSGKDVMAITNDTEIDDIATANQYCKAAQTLVQGNITLLESELEKVRGNRSISKTVVDYFG